MNLYVGNLTYDVVQDDLESLFGQIGPVKSAVVIRDRQSGESRGFGFVEMESLDDGKAAIEKLNGTELKGRNIVVNEAKPRRNNREGRRGSGRGGYGGGSRGGGGRGNSGFRRY